MKAVFLALGLSLAFANISFAEIGGLFDRVKALSSEGMKKVGKMKECMGDDNSKEKIMACMTKLNPEKAAKLKECMGEEHTKEKVMKCLKSMKRHSAMLK